MDTDQLDKLKLTQLKRERNRIIIQQVGNYVRGQAGDDHNAIAAYKYVVNTLFAARALDEEMAKLSQATSSWYLAYLAARYSRKTDLSITADQEAIDDWVAGTWSLINNHLHGAMKDGEKDVAEAMSFNGRAVGDLDDRAGAVPGAIASLHI